MHGAILITPPTNRSALCMSELMIRQMYQKGKRNGKTVKGNVYVFVIKGRGPRPRPCSAPLEGCGVNLRAPPYLAASMTLVITSPIEP